MSGKTRMYFGKIMVAFLWCNISIGGEGIAQTENTHSYTDESLADSCGRLQFLGYQTVSDFKPNPYPLIVANGVIVRENELDKKMVDSAFVVACPESYRDYKGLAYFGIISVETKQIIKSIRIKDVAKSKVIRLNPQKVIYAINGIYVHDTMLLISPGAIIKTELIKFPIVDYLGTYRDFACVDIWTVTKAELKQNTPDKIALYRNYFREMYLHAFAKTQEYFEQHFR